MSDAGAAHSFTVELGAGKDAPNQERSRKDPTVAVVIPFLGRAELGARQHPCR